MTNKEEKMAEKGQKGVIRFKENPFIEDLEIKVGDKMVHISPMGKNTDVMLMNKETGETKTTQLVSYKKVEKDKFVKLFSQNIAMIFDLGLAGIKAFNVLIRETQKPYVINRDIVLLGTYEHKEFLDEYPVKNFAYRTFLRGINELVHCKIIAPSVRQGYYFINPAFIFNGERLEFTNVIEMDKGKDPRPKANHNKIIDEVLEEQQELQLTDKK